MVDLETSLAYSCSCLSYLDYYYSAALVGMGLDWSKTEKTLGCNLEGKDPGEGTSSEKNLINCSL